MSRVQVLGVSPKIACRQFSFRNPSLLKSGYAPAFPLFPTLFPHSFSLSSPLPPTLSLSSPLSLPLTIPHSCHYPCVECVCTNIFNQALWMTSWLIVTRSWTSPWATSLSHRPVKSTDGETNVKESKLRSLLRIRYETYLMLKLDLFLGPKFGLSASWSKCSGSEITGTE